MSWCCISVGGGCVIGTDDWRVCHWIRISRISHITPASWCNVSISNRLCKYIKSDDLSISMLIAPTYHFQEIEHQRDLTTTFLPFILVWIHWEALTHPSATTFAPRGSMSMGSMGRTVYLPTFTIKKSSIHVGKYTDRHMDGFFGWVFLWAIFQQLLNGVSWFPLKGGRYHIIPQLAVYTKLIFLAVLGWLYVTDPTLFSGNLAKQLLVHFSGFL